MTTKIWSKEKIRAHYVMPFFELIYQAYEIHTQNFNAGEIEFCKLSSIKTGSCPEDCAYCPQSAHYKTGLKIEKLQNIDTVLAAANQAKQQGAKRFCMGAAWRNPPKKEFPLVLTMIAEVKKLGLETCVTLGMLNDEEVIALKIAGLDFYNHNLDSSETFYSTIITTRTYQDRLKTIERVAKANIQVCCGGILGMGETRDDRIQMLLTLYQLPTHPKSIPINKLIPIQGTPLADAEPIDAFEFIKTIAITRLMFPTSKIRLAAGRESMSEEMQAWCFMAGANSIFIGNKLLTAKNSTLDRDHQLLKKLTIKTPTCTS